MALCGLIQPGRGSINLNYRVDLVFRQISHLQTEYVCLVHTEYVLCTQNTLLHKKDKMCTKWVAMHRNEPKLIQNEA